MGGKGVGAREQRAPSTTTRGRSPSRSVATTKDSEAATNARVSDDVDSTLAASCEQDPGDSSTRLRVDSLVSLSIDMDVSTSIASDAQQSVQDPDLDEVYVDPEADAVFARAARGLLESVFIVTRLAEARSLASDGDLQFPLDLEALQRDADPHGAVLELKRKGKPSRTMAHMTMKSGPSRSPSRASSRAASRFGAESRRGAPSSSALSLRNSVLAVKLAQLSFQSSAASTATPMRATSDPFRIVPWDTASDVHAQPASHAASKLFGSSSADTALEYVSTPDYAALGPLAGSTSRVPFDFREMQRRDEIASDLDARERRQRIARDVRRKHDLKLKLRSLADPTVSLEAEEARALAASRAGSSRALLRPQTRSGNSPERIPGPDASALSLAKTSAHLTGDRSRLAQPQQLPLHHAVTGGTKSMSNSNSNSSSGGSNALAPGTATFRQEDYDGLQSDVVLLERDGNLLVGENCFLVAKKPRHELLLDLFQKSSIEPRVHLPPSPCSTSPSELAPTPAQTTTASPTALKATGLERQPSRHGSPDRSSHSRNSPGRRGSDIARQDALFDGVRGSFESFPKLELDPKKTPLTKGVTLKASDASVPTVAATPAAAPVAGKAHMLAVDLRSSLKSTGATSATLQQSAPLRSHQAHATMTTRQHTIHEHTSNDALEQQLHGMLRHIASTDQPLDARRKAPPLQHLSSALPTTEAAEPSTGTGPPQQAHSSLATSEARPLSKQHHKAALLRTTRTRTPACSDRPTRKALHSFNISRLDLDAAPDGDTDTDADARQQELYSLQATSGATRAQQQQQFHSAALTQSMGLPRVKATSPYQREFPTPPIGHITIVSSAKASALASNASPAFPLAALPTVLRGRR